MSRALCVLFLAAAVSADFSFEDTRCRCVCPNTRYFVGENSTVEDNHRRYYTMTNIDPTICNPTKVVKKEVSAVIDDAHMDAFLANCDCRHESRNTVMLKVVVIFVICLIVLLVVYMGFLMCLDPMLRKQPFAAPYTYRQHNDEMESNIFAPTPVSSDEGAASSGDGVRVRNTSNNVLERVEAEQTRWMRKVEEQRKNIFTDHTMLN